ncbi:putative protein IQ-DOMAIN 1-like [Capsicum annuum]|nr:putative protein IQ-DOMAIN 1-like [Capsicum annuum]
MGKGVNNYTQDAILRMLGFETRLFTLRRVHRSQSTAGHQQRPTANADERGLSEDSMVAVGFSRFAAVDVIRKDLLVECGQADSYSFARDIMQNGNAEAAVYNSKVVNIMQEVCTRSVISSCWKFKSTRCILQKLEDAMHETGLKLKHHEENIIFLKAQKNGLDNSILDMQVAFGKYHTAGKSGSENEELSHVRSEEETIEHILKHEKSAAGIWCQLKTHHGTQASHLPMLKDILGVVAMLGNVDDDNLNRWTIEYVSRRSPVFCLCVELLVKGEDLLLGSAPVPLCSLAVLISYDNMGTCEACYFKLLSDYLGLETMLAIVCKTYDSIKSLEAYDKEGHVNKTLGLHGLGASIQRPLDGRFLVICLEKLRPYPDDFIADDPQRRLDIPKPRLPNGESPPGFLGFAVNMVNIDSVNLYCATSTGYGLRETLFYSLFSRLHVYKTREDMLQALPCIRHGAISLDGGMIKHNGVFSLGKREIDVKFPKSSGRSSLPQNYFEMERQIKEMKWKKERAVEDMQREQALLDHARFNFDIKKQEYLKFLAQSSSYATQFQKASRFMDKFSVAIIDCIKCSNYRLAFSLDGAASTLTRGRGFDSRYGENSVGSTATLVGPATRDPD